MEHKFLSKNTDERLQDSSFGKHNNKCQRGK